MKEAPFRWGQFLKARREMIRYWAEVEHKTWKEIVALLTPDEREVRGVYESDPNRLYRPALPPEEGKP